MSHLPLPAQNTAQNRLSSEPNSPWDSVEDLPEPVLPWMKSESRQSFGASSRSSVESGSLHVVKRYQPDPDQKKRQIWTARKWWILFSNAILFCYGLGILLLALLTFFKLYQRADVVIVGERMILNLITATGVICLFSSILGFVGIMLNNRAVLTFYNLFLWVCFGMIAAIGYVAYRKAKWNIEGKLSYQWHYDLTSDGRSRIQANLHCCGYKQFTDFHERSNKCFPRTLLPGCRFKYQQFTKDALKITWIVAFSLIPLHLFVLITALLCSNHINRKFGKNLPPKIYRLDYQGIVAGTPTGSSINLHHDGLQQRNR
ncbi:Tetraspanin family-domain-containing protein [Phascolomyces articulosus]|uniref:Tetraspanin family-domain-containing protein n=1 Tax=Phascolomyces articulosus TaxID=60185 RepID=A0AAD5PCI3_9FUNG|nr:Tetraspanin family-domain-containing protein [Phascolomyces articulosus]